MSEYFLQVKAFRSRLQQLGGDYVCNSVLPAQSVSVLFLGAFEGREVLWNMTLSTLAGARTAVAQAAAGKKAGVFSRPFIEINEGKAGVYPLRICLDLVTIDAPVIKKTIIMIRNYKRLKIGSIEFGNFVT